MKKLSKIFLSYSRKDSKRAEALERALTERGMNVWRDTRSITAGGEWPRAIEEGIREARGVVVLLTEASAGSQWVMYEYAFAVGAAIPIVAVLVPGTKVPWPLGRFQVVPLSDPETAVEKIDKGLTEQARCAREGLASVPQLVAKLQEDNGRLVRIGSGRVPPLGIDLWVEHASPKTRSVNFEVLDYGFEDPKWSEKRGKDPREFLTDDMNSYGDVEIWARGNGPGSGTWLAKSGLYEALVRFHTDRPANAEIRRGLKQIRKN